VREPPPTTQASDPSPTASVVRRTTVSVSVVDGDTGRRVDNASVTAEGANRVGRGLFALSRPARATVWAPHYETRTFVLPVRYPRVAVRLYRPDGQWPMYGVDASRTQSHPGIHLRPPFRVVWSRDLGGLLEFPAVVADGIAYISNLHGHLFALSMDTGKTLWQFDMHSYKEASSPAVVGDLVVAHSWSGRVFVLDRTTGQLRWSWGAAGGIESSPVVRHGIDYFGDWAGNVYALDLGRHALRWTYRDGCKITASAAIAGGTVFVGDYCGRLLALAAGTGALRFAASAGSPVYGTAAVAGGRVFVPSRDDGSLVAFTTRGRRLWRVGTGAYVYSAPAVWNGRVFFGSYNGFLYCVSVATGATRWKVYAGGRISGSPTVIDGIVYAGSFAHRIVGVDARTGRVVFRFPHGEYVAVSGNRGRLLLYGWSSVWAVEARR
jgi:outer membrane protein assembly factor BamB